MSVAIRLRCLAMSRASGRRTRAGRSMMAGSLNRLVRNGGTASGESGPPRFIKTTAHRAISDGLGQQTCQGGDILRRRLQQHAMPEIEDEGAVPERCLDVFDR